MVPKTERVQLDRQADLLERAGRCLPGGGLGLFVLPSEVNLVIVEGHGSHLTDARGRDFIDYHLGSGPALLGHAHPEVVAAVERQLRQGVDLLLPQRARDPAGGAARRRDPVRGAGALHRVRDVCLM